MAQGKEGRYIFDTAAEGEDVRLGALEAAFDETTRRHLLDRGLGEGWRCLEVGAGAGSIARFLCEQVGGKGRVVATDLTTQLIEGLDVANLEVRRHDIVSDALEVGEFDLVHSRLVLEHIPQREAVLAKLVAALAPGGWLVIEDFELSWGGLPYGPGARVIPSMVVGLRAMLRRHGYDARFARRLPVLFQRLGLADVGGEGRALVLVGGTDSVNWARPNLERFRQLLLEGPPGGAGPGRLQQAMARWPALKGLLGARIDRLETILADPEFSYVTPLMISAWGRRPAG